MPTTERLMPVFTSTARYASRRPVAPADALLPLIAASQDMAETYAGPAGLSETALIGVFAARVLLHQLVAHHDDSVPSYAVTELARALDALLYPEAVAEPMAEPSNLRPVAEEAAA